MAAQVPASLDAAVDRAEALFAEIGARTADAPGVTRTAYGASEQAAHDIVAARGRAVGLEVRLDAALNLLMTLPGRDRTRPAVMVGSHLDSVPHGGNYDGLAGVLAGLACLDHFWSQGLRPGRDVTLMALRAEENAWFGAQHVGSRAALGRLGAGALDAARRIDTGRSLADHMRDAGADLAPIRAGTPLLDPSRIAAFLECHIEQGALLVERDRPAGIVTAIRGTMRCREAVCLGEAGHAGVVPRARRHDAVMAVAELVMRIDGHWAAVELAGGDLVATVGVLATDPTCHGVTIIPEKVTFTIDLRSHSAEVLARSWAAVEGAAEEIGAKRGVAFRFAPPGGDQPVAMDAGLRRLLREESAALGLPAMEITSGAGHDAGDFAAAGIPSAMIFIRNRNGSHNPDEAMDIADFAAATRLLARTIERLAFQE